MSTMESMASRAGDRKRCRSWPFGSADHGRTIGAGVAVGDDRRSDAFGKKHLTPSSDPGIRSQSVATKSCWAALAAVAVNGKTTCSLPCSVHVQAGDVVVKVFAPGFLPITRTVSVEARRTSNQVFTLVSASREKTADNVSPAKVIDRAPGDNASHA